MSITGIYNVSDWNRIESGVPRGSVLSSLIILIYTNDLDGGIKSQIKFFSIVYDNNSISN